MKPSNLVWDMRPKHQTKKDSNMNEKCNCGDACTCKDEGMTFKAYQKKAATTAIYPYRGNNLNYTTLGLCGESGEFADKVKKIMRDHEGVVSDTMRLALAKELGDVLWYVSNCCDELGIRMEEVAVGNLNKLAERAEKGKLQGSGDNR